MITVRVAGFAVEGGKVYMAVACAAKDTAHLLTAVDSGIRRIEQNTGLDAAHAHVDLTHRIEQHLRALEVSRVGLVATRKLTGLKYVDAEARATRVCAVMAACVECGVEYRELKTSAIGKHIGADPKALEQADPVTFGFDEVPTYWKAGIAKAYGAAAFLLTKSAAS